MVGGPPEAFDRLRPMLAAIGKRVVHAGDIGAGHAVKALNNLMSAAHLIVSSEALIAGRRFGLDPAVMLEIINGVERAQRLDREQVAQLRAHREVRRRLQHPADGQGHRLALGIEHATGTPSPASEAALAAWEAALAELPGDADHTAIARWLDRG